MRQAPVKMSIDEIEKRIGKIVIASGVNWFVYVHNDPHAVALRKGKYNDQPEIIEHMAGRLAEKLMQTGVLADVDLLVPVPMHWLKRQRRTYNQAVVIAQQISRHSGARWGEPLLAVRGHKSQTRGSADRRKTNVSNMFEVIDSDAIRGKHIAVVDDILTTGSTLKSVIGALQTASPAKISIFTLGITP